MASIQKTYNSMGLPMNINRSNPISIDSTELWYNLEDATDYALNDPRAYVGQTIKVLDETTKAISTYTIGFDGELIDQNSSNIFIGTKEAYNTAYEAGEITVGTLVCITDDDDEDVELDPSLSESSTTAELGKAILGQMILG